jgi:hypothetical protein
VSIGDEELCILHNFVHHAVYRNGDMKMEQNLAIPRGQMGEVLLLLWISMVDYPSEGESSVPAFQID